MKHLLFVVLWLVSGFAMGVECPQGFTMFDFDIYATEEVRTDVSSNNACDAAKAASTVAVEQAVQEYATFDCTSPNAFASGPLTGPTGVCNCHFDEGAWTCQSPLVSQTVACCSPDAR